MYDIKLLTVFEIFREECWLELSPIDLNKWTSVLNVTGEVSKLDDRCTNAYYSS